ncbi:MAG: hypothetical protein GC162_20870 [Planctomycetes bacterium]|nr:hypothetical protein [Planctomycetota bacterium]
MTEDQQTYQRAAGASLLGLGVQLLVSLGLLILSLWAGNGLMKEGNQSLPLMFATWHAFGGLALWVSLWLVYQQHKLERIEALEAEQLAARHGTDTSIFETTIDDLSVARRRLAWLYKWIVPTISLLTSAYLITVGVLLLRTWQGSKGGVLPTNVGMTLAFCSGLCLVTFLVSRYLAGMARQPAWSLLRGGAGYLMGTVLITAALAITLTMAHFDVRAPYEALAPIIPAFMIVIGIEIVLNFILDIYRPRKPGEIPRPAFDSRVLSLLTSPESIAHTINEAINYQFGFEITRSWFWQLLSRVFGTLVLFGVAAMLAMSCLVVVQPNEQALVTRFGRLAGGPLDPGLHFKLPWPISSANFYDVSSVRIIDVGSGNVDETAMNPEEEAPLQTEDKPILWSNKHLTGETNLIVAPSPYEASPSEQEGTGTTSSPRNSLVNAEVIVQYRISDLVQYVLANADADEDDAQKRDMRLRNLAGLEVSRLLLQHDIDQWIGPARLTAGKELRERLQKSVDEKKLGFEILDVAVASIHPPLKVADAFHQVVSAEQDKQAAIEEGRQHAIETLARVAGTEELARRIDKQIDELKQMETSQDVKPEQVQEQTSKVEALMREAGGSAAVSIAQARAYRWEREETERGKAVRFVKQAEAYDKAPNLYRMRAYLKVLEEGLADARKYILLGKRGNLTIRGDFKDLETSFGGALGATESK